MKKYKIFKNAFFMHQGGFVYKTDETDRRIYYEVTDPDSEKKHMVLIELTDNKVWSMSCDCTSQSIKSKYMPICSHMMAVIRQATYEFGKSW